MKKLLVLFMVLFLFVGCQKKDEESAKSDITYICYFPGQFSDPTRSQESEVTITVSGDYSKLLKHGAYIVDTYGTEEEAIEDEMLYTQLMIETENVLDDDFEMYDLKRNGNVVTHIRDWTPADNKFSKKELDEWIAWYESEGAVCELQK